MENTGSEEHIWFKSYMSPSLNLTNVNVTCVPSESLLDTVGSSMHI
jgi:hypothetical protein